jgi:hypothetical protein
MPIRAGTDAGRPKNAKEHVKAMVCLGRKPKKHNFCGTIQDVL